MDLTPTIKEKNGNGNRKIYITPIGINVSFDRRKYSIYTREYHRIFNDKRKIERRKEE